MPLLCKYKHIKVDGISVEALKCKIAVSASNFHLKTAGGGINRFFCFQDGHIDFREFMIVLYIMSNGSPGNDKDARLMTSIKTSPEENLKQIFRVFDINNDGTITLKVSWIL